MEFRSPEEAEFHHHLRAQHQLLEHLMLVDRYVDHQHLHRVQVLLYRRWHPPWK